MINSVADILLKLKEEEEKKVNEFNDGQKHTIHTTIIGDMYEGIAKKLLEKTIFESLDLKVTSGQITNTQGDLSSEVDCMIVEGDGEKIPSTDKYIYDISNVIAVIEVKKSLNKKDLQDSYDKMEKLSRMFDPRDMSANEFSLFSDAFKSITGIEVPEYKSIKNFPQEIEMIYHTLLIESMMPLRIVFGFYGYRSMGSLRKGFINFLEEKISTRENQIKGFGPTSFPNHIFTWNYSLVKANGMPYVGLLDDNKSWELMISSTHNPLLHFLELLWTKLSYKHQISSDIFGDDLTTENFFKYLTTKFKETSEQKGWEYKYIPLPEDLDTAPTFNEWEPHKITKYEFLLINLLVNHGTINTKFNIFNELIEEAGIDEDTFIKNLNVKRLVYKDGKNNLILLTDECVTTIKDGNYYAGENKDGKMMKWILKKTSSS